VVDIINLASSADTLLKDRVAYLRARGIDNRIICMDGPQIPKLIEAGIPVFTVPLPRGYDPVKLLTSLVRIARYLRRENIDLVHTHCSIPGFVGRIAAWLAGVPAIVHTVHGFHFHDNTPTWKRSIFVALERLAGLCTHTLLSQNRHDMEEAARHGIVPRERLRHIGNGIKLERFPGSRREAEAGEPLTITCIARLEPVKNHRMLFESARRLKERGHRFRILAVGDGALRSEYEALCTRLNIRDSVQFLGYREDIPELLAETDISVLTSVKEGIPRALLESMAMGIPVVATRVNGNREVVQDGETGLMVELDDDQGLTEALERLMTDPGLRRAIGSRSREVAFRDYDESSIAEAILTVYRGLLARGVARKVPSPRTVEP
jgi:glycosyltransferase involved in cell wall biosynthesis